MCPSTLPLSEVLHLVCLSAPSLPPCPTRRLVRPRQRMARPVCKRLLRSDLSSLHQRIRSQGSTLAKMEIRASRS